MKKIILVVFLFIFNLNFITNKTVLKSFKVAFNLRHLYAADKYDGPILVPREIDTKDIPDRFGVIPRIRDNAVNCNDFNINYHTYDNCYIEKVTKRRKHYVTPLYRTEKRPEISYISYRYAFNIYGTFRGTRGKGTRLCTINSRPNNKDNYRYYISEDLRELYSKSKLESLKNKGICTRTSRRISNRRVNLNIEIHPIPRHFEEGVHIKRHLPFGH